MFLAWQLKGFHRVQPLQNFKYKHSLILLAILALSRSLLYDGGKSVQQWISFKHEWPKTSVKCNLCLYTVSLLLLPFLHLFCSFLVYCILFLLPLTKAPISLVEVNYGSQAVEGLKRSFFFFFFCMNTGYTPSLATPPSIVCHDKIWTEVLLGKLFISQV